MFTELWKKFSDLCSGNHEACPGCALSLKLTGTPPDNAAEVLVKKLMGQREEATLHWLEQQIARALYSEELRKGAHVLDIGIGGPAFFDKETRQILDQIRPEFGVFTHAGLPEFSEAVYAGKEKVA